jgi:predicted TIM-barrel fold metal-dependent hydrolase
MYKTANGDEIFVVDTHVHYWDGRPENFVNVHGQQFIDCFYGYHKALSPPDQVWPQDKFRRYSIEDMHRDLFVEGYDDVAIFQPTYLKEFYKNGFNTTEQNAVLKEKYPEKFILNGSFDPREGARGLDGLRALHEKYKIRGVKLYTAEWKGDSRGWKLTDPSAERYLAECQKLGITNIHVHKGPTILPLNRDAFDVADIDYAATNFPELTFIVEHCGLPRLDDFCWIAVQEPNVYGGLAVAMAFIHVRPDYFNHVLSELLFWLGPDRLTFASDYAIWTPKWIIDKFMALDFPDQIKRDKGVSLDLDVKRKILGLNAAKLYDLEVPASMRIADKAVESTRQPVEPLRATL